MIKSIRRQLLNVYFNEAALVEASATVLHSPHARLSDTPVDDFDLALIEASYLKRRSDGLLGGESLRSSRLWPAL